MTTRALVEGIKARLESAGLGPAILADITTATTWLTA